jgi:hypothetical protein
MAKPCLLYCFDGEALCGRGDPPATSVPVCTFLLAVNKAAGASAAALMRAKRRFCPNCLRTLHWCARVKHGGGPSR